MKLRLRCEKSETFWRPERQLSGQKYLPHKTSDLHLSPEVENENQL